MALEYIQQGWISAIERLEFRTLRADWGYEGSRPHFERAQREAMQFNPIAAWLISRYEYGLVERVKRRVLK